MNIQIEEICRYLDENHVGYRLKGDKGVFISACSSIANLKPESISWVKNKEKFDESLIAALTNIVIVLPEEINISEEMDLKSKALIICENPKAVFFSILKYFFSKNQYPEIIQPSSVVDTESIGKNVYIGHHCYIGEDVSIGNNVVIENNVSIEGVVSIGHNTRIHSGVVIGSDGFGYYTDSLGLNAKVPHFGGVTIGENVEIGANTCIDRGTLDNTIIGNNVKIDNLCHIAHNVEIEDNCMVIALSMLGGSAKLGKNSYIAPGAMIKNQLTIGQNSLVGMGAVATKDVEDNKVVAGVPAKVIKERI